MRRRALSQFRCPFVEGEYIGITVLIECADTPWLVRVIPSTCRKLDHAWPDRVSDMGSGKARTAIVPDEEQISFTYSAVRSIGWIDPQRFTALYFSLKTQRRWIKLAVQTDCGLI
jgi:hypothetical protein